MSVRERYVWTLLVVIGWLAGLSVAFLHPATVLFATLGTGVLCLTVWKWASEHAEGTP